MTLVFCSYLLASARSLRTYAQSMSWRQTRTMEWLPLRALERCRCSVRTQQAHCVTFDLKPGKWRYHYGVQVLHHGTMTPLSCNDLRNQTHVKRPTYRQYNVRKGLNHHYGSHVALPLRSFYKYSKTRSQATQWTAPCRQALRSSACHESSATWYTKSSFLVAKSMSIWEVPTITTSAFS